MNPQIPEDFRKPFKKKGGGRGEVSLQGYVFPHRDHMSVLRVFSADVCPPCKQLPATVRNYH